VTMNTTAAQPRLKERERTAILQSLRAGVVPRVGLQHIQVGRKAEVAAVLRDFDIAKDSGASFRLIVGRYGSGKSFFLNLASTVALEKGFLVARADVTLDRRFHGSSGQARALFSELMRNLSSKARPDGNALTGVVERWIASTSEHTATVGDDEAKVEAIIRQQLRDVHELVGGFDFATVLARYYLAHQRGDAAGQDYALKWLRGEYSTKTEARQDLGVRTIIDDSSVYDHLKLFAKFARLAGYSGLLVCVDELVVLSHRLSSARARAANYEQLLRMLNDCMQGNVEGLSILLGATDEALEDRRRGLYSYEALATRLAPNEFVKAGVQDLSGPVIRLQNLTPEDLYVLLTRIRDVFALQDKSKYLLPDDGLHTYIEYCARTLGEAYFRTPRDSVTRFVGLLSLIEQDSQHDWRALLGHVAEVAVPPNTSAEADSSPTTADEEDDLTTFRL
jgi:hypothetical protein